MDFVKWSQHLIREYIVPVPDNSKTRHPHAGLPNLARKELGFSSMRLGILASSVRRLDVSQLKATHSPSD